jgi:hypothetical protein
MERVYKDMLSSHPAESEELRKSLRNGLEQSVKYHNDTKAGSDLGLSFADEQVADPENGEDELVLLEMECINNAADEADTIDKADKKREERDEARFQAEEANDREIGEQSWDEEARD